MSNSSASSSIKPAHRPPPPIPKGKRTHRPPPPIPVQNCVEVASVKPEAKPEATPEAWIAKIDAIMKHETLMPYEEFKEYFMDGDDKYKDSQEDGGDGLILVKWGWDSEDEKGYMCKMRWKVEGSKRQILRFNGSSIFAFWWSQYSDDVWSEDDEE